MNWLESSSVPRSLGQAPLCAPLQQPIRIGVSPSWTIAAATRREQQQNGIQTATRTAMIRLVMVMFMDIGRSVLQKESSTPRFPINPIGNELLAVIP